MCQAGVVFARSQQPELADIAAAARQRCRPLEVLLRRLKLPAREHHRTERHVHLALQFLDARGPIASKSRASAVREGAAKR